MPIQLVTVVSQLVPSAMVVDVHTGHVTPSTMHMDPCRLWQTLLLHPLRNIPPSPTQWDIPQIQPTMAHFITPWRHPNYKCESVCVWYGCVSYCLLLFQEGSCAVLCVSLCWLVLVCTYYLNLGEKARIPYPFFMPAAVSRRFLCWFVFVLELVCSCLYLLFQA